MEFVGLQQQINSNNRRSIALLIAFPLLILGLTYAFYFILINLDAASDSLAPIDMVNDAFFVSAPYFLAGVVIWFLIAWMSHSSIIKAATNSKPLERKENKRVYNLLENLCISRGIEMPKLYIIPDDSLNAFATGLSKSNYSISLSRGIIDKLDDEELEGVIAHELTHIRNKDVRLLVISVIFVGIFAFLAEMAMRSMRYRRFSRNNDSKGNSGAIMLVILLLAGLGYLISLILKSALSQKREYLADAGAVEMTKNAPALASALRKVSGDPVIEAVKNEDVAQMFIEHPSQAAFDKKSNKGFSFSGIFATHPPIDKRIAFLEQM